jgi:hypothetical protein
VRAGGAGAAWRRRHARRHRGRIHGHRPPPGAAAPGARESKAHQCVQGAGRLLSCVGVRPKCGVDIIIGMVASIQRRHKRALWERARSSLPVTKKKPLVASERYQLMDALWNGARCNMDR